MNITLGQKVRHICRTDEHDSHIGLVCEITETRRLCGATTVDIWVRWIKPDGNPSDGLTRHAPTELAVYA